MAKGGREAGEEAGAELAKGFAATAAAVEVSRAVFSFLGDAVTAATDLGETLSKTDQVFGESADTIHDWAAGAAESFGQSRAEAENAAGTFGNMFLQLGIGGEAATEMSKSMVELASDFASFHNADISEVLEAQTAAFRGEYDAVQRFVPTINAAAVEQKALEMGLASTSKELTQQDKALATNALLMQGAGKAAGDFDRTSDSLANRQRVVKAEIENLKASIGEGLLPVMQVGVTVLQTMVGGFTALPGPVQTGVVVLGGFAAAAVAVSKGIETAREVLSTFSGATEAVRAAVGLKTAATVVDTAATAAGTAADSAGALASFAAANASELEALAVQNAARAEVAGTAAATSLAVANSAVAESGAAAGVGMAAALGPLGLIAGAAAVVGGAFLLLRDRHDAVAEAAGRVEQAVISETGAFDKSTESLSNYLAETSAFAEGGIVETLNAMGVSYDQLSGFIARGSEGMAEFGRIANAAKDAGKINADQLLELGFAYNEEAKGAQRAAEAGAQELRARGLVSEAALASARALNTAADGTVNWVAVNKELSGSLATTATAAGAAASSTASYGAAASAATYSVYSLAGAAKDFNAATAANITSVFGVTDAERNYTRAVEAATKETKSGGGAQRDAAKDARQMEDALGEVADAEEALALAIEKRQLVQAGPTENQVKIAEIEARQRKRALADATDEVREAEIALQEAQKSNTGAAIAEAIAAQERAVAAAKRDVERAASGVAGAEERLAEARAAGDPGKIEEAERDLADAKDRLTERTDAARGAQDGLKTAQDLGEESARKIGAAARELEGAQDDVTLASMAADQAEKDLTETRNIGKEGSKELKAANDEVEAAQRAVESATQRVRDLESELNTQRTGGGGSIETTATLEEKTLAVASAGQQYIEKLIAMGAPTDTIDRALGKLHEDLGKVAEGSPEATAAAAAFFERISADADAAKFKISDVQGAAEELARVLDEGYRTSIEIALGLTPPSIPGRASGGPVSAGGLYVVGERGPELVQFGGDAAVFPTDQLRSAVGAMGGPAPAGGDMVQVSIGQVVGTEAGARRVASLTGAAVARVLSQRRLSVDARGPR